MAAIGNEPLPGGYDLGITAAIGSGIVSVGSGIVGGLSALGGAGGAAPPAIGVVRLASSSEADKIQFFRERNARSLAYFDVMPSSLFDDKPSYSLASTY